ncbi:hypothetical protein ACFQY5_18925 [Paeniroseomonas aquatica]|uniref:Lantibiotic n=1 Tax=Paeniroseomonas aquatica TaxID=373043 RepID=A0ABT8AE48_9PROT|nr:hypothetical protein [Paeniroseomonas aquatica]MDN3568011.1 hypothetical protein [Paeniroseomonas aquatica]
MDTQQTVETAGTSDVPHISAQKAAAAKNAALENALEQLENLAIGTVESFDSYDSLEAGCLSCSGVKISTD